MDKHYRIKHDLCMMKRAERIDDRDFIKRACQKASSVRLSTGILAALSTIAPVFGKRGHAV